MLMTNISEKNKQPLLLTVRFDNLSFFAPRVGSGECPVTTQVYRQQPGTVVFLQRCVLWAECRHRSEECLIDFSRQKTAQKLSRLDRLRSGPLILKHCVKTT